MQLIFAIAFFFTTEVFAKPSTLDELYLIKGCQIFSMNGIEMKAFPGTICLFLDDGSFITAGYESISMINKSSEVVWEIKGIYHHQVNFSSDKSKILALAADAIPYEGSKLKIDKMQVISLKGEILFEQNSGELFKQKILPPLLWSTGHVGPKFGADIEQSHFNSFYDVPKYSYRGKPLPFKEGDFVLNSKKAGIFFLSSDLKNVVHHFVVPHSDSHSTHDVQVTPRGTILYFNNQVRFSKEQNLLHSSIQEIDPLSMKILNEYVSHPKAAFFSMVRGGIQELDSDLWLFNHVVMGAYIYSKKQKDIIIYIPLTNLEGVANQPAQQVKAEKLKTFLSHWIDLAKLQQKK